MKKPMIAIIMGSDSDLNVMNDAAQILKQASCSFEIKIVSAHRTPAAMLSYARKAQSRGFKLIIAGAGGAAHLPGMVASITTLPVIGVPINIGKMKGLDALLSVAQMPKGIPVATVAVDNATNAGLLAIRILAQSEPRLRRWLSDYQKTMKKKVQNANRRLSRSRP